MSRLDELIKELCPEGVEKKRIGDLCEIKRGRVMSKDYIANNAGEYPVFSSQTENNGELGRISTYDFEGEYLTWTTDGANAGTVFYRKGQFSVTNVCGLLNAKSEIILTKYLFYALSIEAPKYVSSGMGNPKLMSNVMARIKVPVPPLPVQEEIVKTLDKFTDYVTELQAELHLREIQYEELAYRLLIEDVSGEKYKLSEICDVVKGKTPIQKAVPGEYPLVVTKAERGSSDTYQFDAKAVCIPLISSRGHGVASLNHVYYQEGKFALGNILCAVIPTALDIVSPKYLYYYFECTKDYTLVPLMKGGANVAMTVADVANVKVTIPNIKAQNEVITKLIALEEYVNEVLPAEIELRQKQYEYYRDKLLSFKEIEL